MGRGWTVGRVASFCPWFHLGKSQVGEGCRQGTWPPPPLMGRGRQASRQPPFDSHSPLGKGSRMVSWPPSDACFPLWRKGWGRAAGQPFGFPLVPTRAVHKLLQFSQKVAQKLLQNSKSCSKVAPKSKSCSKVAFNFLVQEID